MRPGAGRARWSSRPNRESLRKRNPELADLIHRRDGACVYCRSTANLQYDHLVPRSQGGTDDARNIVRSCLRCNTSRQDKPLAEWAKYARKIGIRFKVGDVRKQAKKVVDRPHVP